MRSNFKFLNNRWPILAQLGNNAESYVYTDPNSSLIKLGLFAEKIVNLMFDLDGIEKLVTENTHANRIRLLKKEELIPKDIDDILYSIRIPRNKATHEVYGSVDEAKILLELSFKLGIWFMQTYGDWDFESKSFILPEDISKDVDYYSIIEAQEEEIQRLLKENASVSKQMEVSIEARKKRANTSANNIELNEAETRYLIDEQLRKVGWEAVEVTLEEALVHGQTEVSFVYEEIEYTGTLTEAYVDEDVVAAEELADAKEAKVEEINAVTLSEEETSGKTEESIVAANEKLEELKDAALAEVEAAETVEVVQAVEVDTTEALELLEDEVEELVVVLVSAIDATTISVTFEGVEEPVEFTVEEMTHGENEVTFTHNEVEYTETVNYVDEDVVALEEAVAVVSTGNVSHPVKLLPADKVIGDVEAISTLAGGWEGSLDEEGSLQCELNAVIGSTSEIGYHNLTVELY